MREFICSYEGKNQWVNVTRPGLKETRELKKSFSLHPHDLQEVLPPLQRSKVRIQPSYIFLILVFPVYNRETREITPTELDIFLLKDTIITVHEDKLLALRELEKHIEKNSEERESFLKQDPFEILTQILDQIYESLFPMLTHMSNDINEMATQIFNDHDQKLVANILTVKRNIIAFRKAINTHKRTLKNLAQIIETKNIKNVSARFRLSETIEHTREIWDELENYDYTITAIYESHESLNARRLNLVMRTLTIFSVIVFPLTLLAAIFGMNTINMPLVKDPYGFWIILGLMIVGALGMLLVFKRKKWL